MSDVSNYRISWQQKTPMGPADPMKETREKLAEAERLRQAGQLGRAQTICEGLVRRYSDYMGALHTLGLIYADKKDYQRALICLVRAAMLNPRSWMTLTALSGVYLRLDAREMAIHTLEQAAQLRPDDANVLATLGEIYREEREYELAAEAFRKALDVDPNFEAPAVGLGLTSASLGQFAEAARLFEGLIKRGERSNIVVHGLSQLPSAVVRLDTLSLIDRIQRSDKDDGEDFEVSLAFTRASALDKAGRHEEAWPHLVEGNRAVLSRLGDKPRKQTEWQATSLKEAREARVKPRSGPRGAGRKAISLFILGPSRSGKTTMEALVSTLEGVKRGYENPIAENAVRRTFQSAGLLTSRQYVQLPPSLESECRELYLEELARRAGPARVFTNTEPSRIHDVARMASIFPNMRFIFVNRDPDDVALRIFMRKYGSGNFYGYDLATIREHVAWYDDMIDVLAEKLPGISQVIQYEDMIADPGAVLDTAADLCGLPHQAAAPPALGDDRDCSAPYRKLMHATLQQERGAAE